MRCVLWVFPLCHSLATFPSEYSMQWCRGSVCVDSKISAAQLQMKLIAHYQFNRRPPLKQAHFLASLPGEYRDELCLELPGMMTTAMLLVAECLLYTAPQHAFALHKVVNDVINKLSEPQLVVAEGGWPIGLAAQRFERTSRALDANTTPQSVDIVVVHCAEDLNWLLKLDLSPKGRIFLYEKCNATELILPGLRYPVLREVVADRNDIVSNLPARRDECNGYAAHLARTMKPGFELPDYTVFLHGDPADHWKEFTFDYFRLVLKSMTLGRYVNVRKSHLKLT
eukprot:GEMP01030534.1.p1 GENE.GEMP01030534.1~~GEMP01030534.1.p1  ORF type:complete len:283 (+),score=42.47 GEMP01030534.1:123-971(+)